jgi:hypothetical protein
VPGVDWAHLDIIAGQFGEPTLDTVLAGLSSFGI